MKELIVGPNGLIFLGGILSLIGVFWSARNDIDSANELNNKNEIIIQKTEEISELNAKIASILTGGDSFPLVTIGFLNNNQGILSISLKGEHAISNVTGRFIDVRELRADQRKGNFNLNLGKHFEKNIISPAFNQFLDTKREIIDISKGGRYMIHFYTPYHTFTQYLAIEQNEDEGRPVQTYVLYRNDNREEPIYTSYPNNFPIPFDEIDFLEEIPEEEMKSIKKKFSL